MPNTQQERPLIQVFEMSMTWQIISERAEWWQASEQLSEITGM